MENILNSFVSFYLRELSREKPQAANILRRILSTHPTPHEFFLDSRASALPKLLQFFGEISRLDLKDRIVFDVHGNVCWEFFSAELLRQFGWPGHPSILRPDTASGIAQRNSTRRWLLRHLDTEHYFKLEELAALQAFSSGGEAIFLRYVWPSLAHFLSGAHDLTLLDAGCGAGYSSLVLSTDKSVKAIWAVDSSAVRQARFGALMNYLKCCDNLTLQATLEQCYPLNDFSELETTHQRIAWQKFAANKILQLMANLECLPSQQIGKVDGIVCVDVLEHVFDPAATVESFAKVLNPGGRVFVSVPSKFCGLEERLYALTHGQLFPSMLHLNHFSASTLRRLFSKFGFSLCELKRFRAPEYCALNGTEGDLVEALSILEPSLELQDNMSFARHLFAAFEYLG